MRPPASTLCYQGRFEGATMKRSICYKQTASVLQRQVSCYKMDEKATEDYVIKFQLKAEQKKRMCKTTKR